MYKTIAEIKRANKASGGYWFSPATMRCFHSIIHGGVIAGRYFITSETPDESIPRQFKVRVADANGRITTASEKHTTLASAREFARALAAADKVDAQ